MIECNNFLWNDVLPLFYLRKVIFPKISLRALWVSPCSKPSLHPYSRLHNIWEVLGFAARLPRPLCAWCVRWSNPKKKPASVESSIQRVEVQAFSALVFGSVWGRNSTNLGMLTSVKIVDVLVERDPARVRWTKDRSALNLKLVHLIHMWVLRII